MPILLILIALNLLVYGIRSIVMGRDDELQEAKRLIEQKNRELKYLSEKENTESANASRLLSESYQRDREIELEKEKVKSLEGENERLLIEVEQHKINLSSLFSSNLTAMPWLAGMMADFLTYDLEVEAKKLEWGKNIAREKKVASIRTIREEARRRIQEAKEAVYQLEYLRTLYPGIDDVLVTDYKELHLDGTIADHDPVLDYLDKDEWNRLSDAEKNQLALDRYVASRKKSKWQIGRDYELSVAYEYRKSGYEVDTFGSYMGLEDLGRDLIARKDSIVHIVQCKYWSQSKTIHEKHIYQLYGTVVEFCVENNSSTRNVKGIFVTNIRLSDKAKTVAERLGIRYVENYSMTDFPRIKCNVGRDEFGNPTKMIS